MRDSERKTRRAAIRIAGLAIAATIICLSITKPPGATDAVLRPPTGYPQLLAIQDAPDYGEMCLPEPALESFTGRDESNLFAAIDHDSVHAAAQESGSTTRRRERLQRSHLLGRGITYLTHQESNRC